VKVADCDAVSRNGVAIAKPPLNPSNGDWRPGATYHRHQCEVEELILLVHLLHLGNDAQIPNKASLQRS
jgi:hypothetical protein